MWGMEGVQAATPALNFLDVCCRLVGLRHTCASLLIAQGASVKAVQAQLGHATASITLDTYGHLFPSEMDTLGDRLELVRDAAVERLGRTQHGPAADRLGETAGG